MFPSISNESERVEYITILLDVSIFEYCAAQQRLPRLRMIVAGMRLPHRPSATMSLKGTSRIPSKSWHNIIDINEQNWLHTWYGCCANMFLTSYDPFTTRSQYLNQENHHKESCSSAYEAKWSKSYVYRLLCKYDMYASKLIERGAISIYSTMIYFWSENQPTAHLRMVCSCPQVTVGHDIRSVNRYCTFMLEQLTTCIQHLV